MKKLLCIERVACVLAVIYLFVLPMMALAVAEDTAISEDCLVTIELTQDNFDEYFRIVKIDNIQDYTEVDLDTEAYDYYIVASNAYDRGLMLYEGHVYAAQTTYKLDGDTSVTACLGVDLYGPVLKTKKGTVPKFEEWSDYRYGSAVFAKRECVEETSIEEDGGRSIILPDGTIRGMNTYYLFYEDPETNSSRNLDLDGLYALYPY